MTEQPRTLSSAWTFVMKVIVPAVWFAGFGFVVLATWVPGVAPDAWRASLPRLDEWPFVVYCMVSILILWWGIRLKRVRIDQAFLQVSNYWRQASIPLDAIESVTENRSYRLRPITVRFRAPTAFGRKITFMPDVPVFLWGPHPLVGELRRVAGLADAQSSG